MDTNLPAKLHDLGLAIYEAFLLPGNFIVTQFAELAPGLALKLGIDSAEAALPAALSLAIWLLSCYLLWRVARSACLFVYYNFLQVRTYLLCKVKVRGVKRVASNALKKSEIVFDDLDVAILNTGMALAPGRSLSAPDICKHLTKRAAVVQRSLEKLRNYGLLAKAGGSVGGYDSFLLTPSGAALMAMWERQGKVPQ